MPKQTTIIWKIDGKEMIYIPSGEFLMGSDAGVDNETPVHTIHLEYKLHLIKLCTNIN